MAKIADFFVELGLRKEKFDKGMDEAGKKPAQLNNAFKGLGTTIAAAFSVGAIVNFTKQVIQTRAEFEKYEAVLSNLFGDNSIARKHLDQIQDFASSTPFSLNELTDAFVRLANQGFVPAQTEMRKLGDLSASVGKSFIQLSEAIIDAQVGEFERLKEFGIRAQKEGDKVIFTFKGVSTEVDNTAASIQNYILSLGDLEGVSGAMEKISETLGGKISNAGDAWSKFLNTIGSESSGVFSTLISEFSATVDAITQRIEDANKAAGAQSLRGFGGENFVKQFKEGKLSVDQLKQAIDEVESAMEGVSTEFDTWFDNYLQPNKAKKARQEYDDLLNTFYALNDALRESERGTGVQAFDYSEIFSLAADENTKLIEKAKEEKKAREEALKVYEQNLKVLQATAQAAEDAAEAMRKSLASALSDAPKRWHDKMKQAFEDVKKMALPEIGDEEGVDDIPFNTEEMNEALRKAEKVAKERLQEMNDMTEYFIEDMIASFTQGFADLATGDTTLGQFFSSILGQFGEFIQQFGKMLIGYGIAWEAFQKAPGPLKIIAGVALVAIGRAISNFAAKGVGAGAGSAGGSGSTAGMTGGYGTAGGGYTGQAETGGGKLVAEVKGSDLVFILERANNNINRIRP